jgi:hypothetical protein
MKYALRKLFFSPPIPYWLWSPRSPLSNGHRQLFFGIKRPELEYGGEELYLHSSSISIP